MSDLEQLAIERLKAAEVKPEPEGPMVFRYEHPDLVREGIVWNQT
jgi:hypothetical protein